MSWLDYLLNRYPAPRRQRARRMPELVLGPIHGADDLVPTLLAHAGTMHADGIGLEMHGAHWTHDYGADGNPRYWKCGPNTRECFRSSGFYAATAGLRWYLAIGAMKDFPVTWDVDYSAGILNVALARMLEDGAPVPLVTLDEPLTALADAKWPIGMEQVAQFHVDLAQRVPAPLALVERPSRELRIDQILDLCRRVADAGRPFNALHLDVDYWIYGPRGIEQMHRQLRHARTQCRTMGLPLGIILFGHGLPAGPTWSVEASSREWARTAREAMGCAQETFGDDWPERLILQSWDWVESADGDKEVPDVATHLETLMWMRRLLA